MKKMGMKKPRAKLFVDLVSSNAPPCQTQGCCLTSDHRFPSLYEQLGMDPHREALFDFLAHVESKCGRKNLQSWLKVYESRSISKQIPKETQDCRACASAPQWTAELAATPRAAVRVTSGGRSNADSASADTRSRSGSTKHSSAETTFISQVNTASRTLGSLGIHTRLRSETLAQLLIILEQCAASTVQRTIGSGDPFVQSSVKLSALLAFQLQSIDASLLKVVLSVEALLLSVVGSVLPSSAVVNFVEKLLEVAHHPQLVSLEESVQHTLARFVDETPDSRLVGLFCQHLSTVVQPLTSALVDLLSTKKYFFRSHEAVDQWRNFFREKSLKLLSRMIDHESMRVRYIFDDMLSPTEYVVPWYPANRRTIASLRSLRDSLAAKHSVHRSDIVLVTREGDDIQISEESGENEEGADEVVAVHPLHRAFPSISARRQGPRPPAAIRESGSNATCVASIEEMANFESSPSKQDGPQAYTDAAIFECLLSSLVGDHLDQSQGHFLFSVLYILFPLEAGKWFNALSEETQLKLLAKLRSGRQAFNFLLTRPNCDEVLLVDDISAPWGQMKYSARRRPPSTYRDPSVRSHVAFQHQYATPRPSRAPSIASGSVRANGVTMFTGSGNPSPQRSISASYRRSHSTNTYLSVPARGVATGAPSPSASSVASHRHPSAPSSVRRVH